MRKHLSAALSAAALVLAPVQLAGGATGGTGTDAPSTAVHVTPPRVAFRPGPYPLYVYGSGFSGWQVAIWVDGTRVGEPPHTTPNGDFFGTVPLDTMPDCGEHVVSATGIDDGVDFEDDLLLAPSAVTQLVVTCPELTLAPEDVEQASLPQPLTWTVTGFTPETTVALRLAGEPAEVVMVDDEGSATTVLPADGLDCGTVTAEAREVPAPLGLGVVAPPPVPPVELPSASASLLVRCRPPDPEPEFEPPTLVTNPTVVAAGTTTLAVGGGFPPAAAVTLSWMLPDGSVAPPVVTVTAGPDGTFTTPAMVLPHSQLGPRELVAASTVPGVQAAAAPVLVVPGSSQPGRHGLVNRR